MVVDTLTPMDPNRKAWRLVRRPPPEPNSRSVMRDVAAPTPSARTLKKRLRSSEHLAGRNCLLAVVQVGGVLVERTCGEVLPAVQEALNSVLTPS